MTRESGNKATRKRAILITLFLIAYSLAGCVSLPDPETAQDFSSDTVAVVTVEQSVGQTFVARRERLNGIDLWLQTDHPGNLLTVELFHNIEDQSPVFTGNIRTKDGKTRLEIPPLADPPNQHYYLRLSSTQGEVNLLGRDEDNYAKGTAFVDDQPIDADLAFRTTYEYDAGAAFADFRGPLSLWYLILPLGIVLLLPGWLLLDFASLKDKFDWGERVALSLGLSLAIIPIFMLWTSLVGLRWGPISVWLVAGILIALLIWRTFKNTGCRPLNTLHPPPSTPHTPLRLQPSSFILFAIFALTLFTRFAMVRDLAAPPWVDSVHHGLITRLMLESGGLPETAAPYLPLEADYYHFGFHSALASFTWLTGFEIYEGMLIFGQVLNALMVFAVYLLAKTLTKNRPAALTAALISGLFTLMPAYYASWGRYTQLAGLLILPAAFALMLHAAKDTNPAPGRNYLRDRAPAILLAAGSLAGLFLVHYRVMAFWGALLLAYLLWQISPRRWLRHIGFWALIAIISVLLLLPWLPETLVRLLIPTGRVLSGGQAEFSAIPWNFLKPGLGIPALVMAGIGLALGLLQRRRFPFTVLLWTALLYLMANLGVFANVPGAGFINPVSMEITLFMPIAVLGGFAVGGTLELLDKFIPDRWQASPRMGFVILGAGSAILGAQRLLPTLNPITFLAREADFPAIHWIAENIPAGETILINPTGWGYGLYMGNDGGYWISPLSEHLTMPPPVLYGMGTRAEIEHVNGVVEAVQATEGDPAALWELLQTEHIRFVYTGVRGGIVSPRALSESRLFKMRYQQDGTWVFEAVENTP